MIASIRANREGVPDYAGVNPVPSFSTLHWKRKEGLSTNSSPEDELPGEAQSTL